jgi:fructose-specific component phosphotransferase system IIB-like protein
MQLLADDILYISGGVSTNSRLYLGLDVYGGHVTRTVTRGDHGFWLPRHSEYEYTELVTDGIEIASGYHAVRIVKNQNTSSIAHALMAGTRKNQELILTLVNNDESASGGNSVLDGVSKAITNPEFTITKAFLIWDVEAAIWFVMSVETV